MISSVYDKEGHLCPFDSGLIERNVLLYFSGYMKAIYEENSDPEGNSPHVDVVLVQFKQDSVAV